jgi:acyl-CoA reductase-like NAD-dependent aldehyde dehydrogenase
VCEHEPVVSVVSTTAEAVENAVAGAVAIAPSVRRMSSDDRAVILERVAGRLADDADELAAALTAESGFLTHRDMVLEVQRAVEVFTYAAAVARVGLQETINVDAVARGRDAIGLVRHEPIGPILGITAFNGPLLIAAHKVAPAIVAGSPIVLKPSPRVPGGAVALAEVVAECGWPAAAVAVLPVDDETTMRLIHDPRLPVVSFTGGAFGWTIKDAVPRKRVHLEMGGVGAVIVAADADLESAAAECAAGGFVRSGQACIAVQRIYVERAAYERFANLLAGHVRELVVGDPNDPGTGVGPLVDERAAIRVQAMIDDAVSQGARALCGGTREGRIVAPTVLCDVTAEMRVSQQEAFGPVVAVAPVDSLDEAVDATNAVTGAIHAGVYTSDLDAALTVADAIRAGGVIVNGPSSWRVDHMPYGGVGDSGFGREGIRAMVAEYTEPKVLIIRHRPRELGPHHNSAPHNDAPTDGQR